MIKLKKLQFHKLISNKKNNNKKIKIKSDR